MEYQRNLWKRVPTRKKPTVCWALVVATFVVMAGCNIWGKLDPLRQDPLAGEVPLVIEANFPIAEDSDVIREVRALRAELEHDLGLRLSNRRIQVHLFQHEAAFRKFVEERFPQLADRRAIFVSGQTGCHIHALWTDSIASDLRHELTHAYLHTAVGTLPLWLDEGLAEYYEVSPVAGRVNHEHLPRLTEMRSGGYLRLDLNRLAVKDVPEDMTSQHYAEAWLWAHFMMAGEHREILTGYLQAHREGRAVVPIQQVIQAKLPQAEQLVLVHLEQLTATR